MTAPEAGRPSARAYDRYEVWAPSAGSVSIRIDGVEHPMSAAEGGWFHLPDVPAVPGARYAFRLDDAELWLPDPRSLSQPDGVHADSEVVDPRALRGDDSWPSRELRGRVLYELHIGTFTPGPDGTGGTFDSAIERLDELVELGVDAIELLPIATFPGERGGATTGWGCMPSTAPTADRRAWPVSSRPPMRGASPWCSTWSTTIWAPRATIWASSVRTSRRSMRPPGARR